jgi:DEAD/DEAH box helicase domain-containing protein
MAALDGTKQSAPSISADLSSGSFGFPLPGLSFPSGYVAKFSADVERVGTAEVLTAFIRGAQTLADFAGIPDLTACYSEDGELLVFNRGDNGLGFAICWKCGYAESENARNDKKDLPASFKEHPPIFAKSDAKPCRGKNIGRNQILAAREATDVLQIDFSKRLLPSDARDESLMWTFGYALRRAGAKLLELDPREIGVLLMPAGDGGRAWAPVLYDNVPGGAGHVRELWEQGRELLARTRDVLYVNAEHHRRCDTACLDCLLSFDSQTVAVQHGFARRQALKLLDDLLDVD